MNASTTSLDTAAIRRDFPILDLQVHGKHPLIYFDNGASTQRPRAVIEAMNSLYKTGYANVHRGIHHLSETSSALYEATRSKVRQLIGAQHDEEVIFTSGTTLSINTVAHAWGNQHVGPGDEILLTIMEHHSNIVPWQQLAERVGATVRFADLTPDGQLDLEDFQDKLNDKTRDCRTDGCFQCSWDDVAGCGIGCHVTCGGCQGSRRRRPARAPRVDPGIRLER